LAFLYPVSALKIEILENRKLLSHWAYQASWSPDGTKIVYHHGCSYPITVANASTGEILYWISFSPCASDPEWSLDGNKIVFKMMWNSNYDIWIMNADGSDQRSLTNFSGREHLPRFRPQGDKIIFSDENDLWIMNVDGTNQTKLTNTPDYYEDSHAWFPDGNKIIFSRSYKGEARDLWTLNLLTGEENRVTNSIYDEREPDIHPSGRYAIFYSNRTSKICNTTYPAPPYANYDLWIKDLITREEVQITDTCELERRARWSPTGDKIAYEKIFPDNTHEVWIMKINITEEKPIPKEDTIPPTIKIVEFSLTSDKISVVVNASDNSNISSIDIYINEKFATSVKDINKPTFWDRIYIYNTSLLEEGKNIITSIAKDIANNSANDSVIFIKNTTKPIVKILWPENNSILFTNLSWINISLNFFSTVRLWYNPTIDIFINKTVNGKCTSSYWITQAISWPYDVIGGAVYDYRIELCNYPGIQRAFQCPVYNLSVCITANLRNSSEAPFTPLASDLILITLNLNYTSPINITPPQPPSPPNITPPAPPAIPPNITPPEQPSPPTNITPPEEKLGKIRKLLEGLKEKFVSLAERSEAIADYYNRTSEASKAICWREISLMFEALELKLTNIISKIEEIKKPTQEQLDEIKQLIAELRTKIDEVIDKIFECAKL
jgi:Tol biopolymer transport system component